ncbi:MAG: Xaa-Pro peptidase family protein [Oscillospiraceae bacterium]|jgi:Xaa-Pro aminopeptidase|nr:Xaa-Pro peptidase family protein [Oscillospiraceae bacterium]
MADTSGNIGRIMQALRSAAYDCVIITDPANRLFATGFPSSDGLALVTRDSAWFFTDSRYFEAASDTVSGAEVALVSGRNGYSDAVRAIVAAHGFESVGFEDEYMTYSDYGLWRERLDANTRLCAASEMLARLRSVKSAAELDAMKRAQRVAERSFEQVLPLICAGITERELAAELIYRFMLNGAEDKSFDPIVVSGARSSMPHGVPSDSKLQPGFLTIDFGVRLGGWCSDTTRTLCIGEPTDEMRRVYGTVLRAQECGIAAARAGATGRDVDAAARREIEQAGYGEYFGHGFGHGLGLEIHEQPNAAHSNDKPLPAGAVISAEPGIYIPGRFGVRIEDVLYITADGCENITTLPKELAVLAI